MKKLLLYLFLLSSIVTLSQSSRFRVMNNTKFGWTQKMVPVKMYSDSTWLSILFKEDLPNFGSGFWSLAGNTLTNTTSFVGTTNNTSLFLKTNTGTNLGYVKLDSIGDFIWKQPSTIGQNNFQISRWKNSGFDLPAIYFGIKVPTAYNYLVLHDSLAAVFNSPSTMILRNKNNTFLTAVTTPTTTGNAILISGISQPSVAAGAGIRHIQVSGVTLGYAAGTTALVTKILFSADTYSANVGATITTAIGLDVIQPIQGTNMTFTNRFAGRFQGNLNVTAQSYFGASAITPSAVVHLAAGNSTLPAMRFTSQTAVSSPSLGEMFWNSTTGFNWQGNSITSGTVSSNGFQMISGSMSVTTKGINTTAGDGATINSPVGRFRKDNSGSSFVLTNSQITANSIVVLTLVTAGITTGYQLSVQAGAGSATITFETAGVAAAPSANCDVNFYVIN